MDEEIKKLLKSMKKLGDKLRNESLKKKERSRLEREWKLKNQEVNNYLRKFNSKIQRVLAKGKTEESKRLKEEWMTIVKVSYNSNPHIAQTWNPFSIQRIIEGVYKRAQEKKLEKNKVKKGRSMIKMRYNMMSLYFNMEEIYKDPTKNKYFFYLKEYARDNPDPKLVRTMLLAWKDYDEGRIDNDTLKRLSKEFRESTNRAPSPQEFREKYPVFNPLKKNRKKKYLG